MTDPLAVFLYLLMRDELPSGRVVRIVRDVEEARHDPEGVKLSSDWLAAHAQELADRITDPQVGAQ